MEARRVITHEKYVGIVDPDGYGGQPTYQAAVSRLVFGWQPETLDTTATGDYTKRVTDRVEVLVPSVDPYSPLDKLTLSGQPYLVDQIRDYTTGPFGFEPGGVIVVERVTG